MLTLKVVKLDDGVRMIVQAVRYKMLQQLKDELERTEKEAAYMVTMTDESELGLPVRQGRNTRTAD